MQGQDEQACPASALPTPCTIHEPAFITAYCTTLLSATTIDPTSLTLETVLVGHDGRLYTVPATRIPFWWRTMKNDQETFALG